MAVIANNGAKFPSECFLSFFFFRLFPTSEGGERSNNGWKCHVKVIKRSSTRSSPWILLDSWQLLSSFTTTTNTTTNTLSPHKPNPVQRDHCNDLCWGSRVLRQSDLQTQMKPNILFIIWQQTIDLVLYLVSTFYRRNALFNRDQQSSISDWVHFKQEIT